MRDSVKIKVVVNDRQDDNVGKGMSITSKMFKISLGGGGWEGGGVQNMHSSHF